MTVPHVFGLPHLSEDAVAAFADGVLSSSAAARAQRHCTECRECAQAVRVQRETALMLRTSSSPSLPAGLMDRLAGLPMSAPLPPPRGGLPTALGSDGVPVFVTHRSAPPTGEAAGEAHRGQFHAYRRALLPVGILASAAVVVAAGALGTTGSHLQQPVEQQPASINLTNSVVSSHPSADPSGAPNTATGTGRPAPAHRSALDTPVHPAP
jgi:hypothetical protein